MPLACRSSTAARIAAGTSMRSVASPFGVPSGSALENGVANAAAPPSWRQISRKSTAPRDAASARRSHAASTSHAAARSAPPPRQAATSGSRTSSPVRLRLEKKTACRFSSVKPGAPSPSVPASRCSAMIAASRVRGRLTFSSPITRGKPVSRTSAFGSQNESLELNV